MQICTSTTVLNTVSRSFLTCWDLRAGEDGDGRYITCRQTDIFNDLQKLWMQVDKNQSSSFKFFKF